MNWTGTAFAASLAMTSVAQAQSVIGTWVYAENPSIEETYSADGRWQQLATGAGAPPNCNGSNRVEGPYTLSGNSITRYTDKVTCGSTVLTIDQRFQPATASTATFEISASTLTMRIQIPGASTTATQILTAKASSTSGTSSVIGTPTTALTPLPPAPATQVSFTASSGQIPDVALAVSSSGTFGSANLIVSLDLAQGLQAVPATGISTTYNAYVAALVPGAAVGSANAVWYVKTSAGSWIPLSHPLPPYIENVPGSTPLSLTILSGNDLTGLIGTEVYVGFGSTDAEMLSTGRFRGIFKAQ